MAISVLLVDDHELIRQGLRRAFERDGDFEVAGEAGSLADARRLIALLAPGRRDPRRPAARRQRPRGLPQDPRATTPSLGIVILTMYAGDDQLFEALEAGASAFVPKNAPAEDVVAAARHAASLAALVHRGRPATTR